LAGVGALYEQFARLKARLEAAGWFKPERKRALPAFPRAVGIVSSRHAAALRDVLTTIARRFPSLPVVLYPTAVQGQAAAPDIVEALKQANVRAEVDVLIVCRGGGSIEDLWAFNEETVARAVFESAIPVVSGVGHETDFTICDFVADARAATPTAAAALVAPDRAALRTRLSELRHRWRRAAALALEPRMQRVDLVSHRLVHPASRLQAQREVLAALARRLMRAVIACTRQRERECTQHGQRILLRLQAPLPQHRELVDMQERWRRAVDAHQRGLERKLAALDAGLRHLGPQAVLQRGYSIVATAEGMIVQDATQIAEGDGLRLRFARGGALATVTRKDD
jgi:exodeoxyribonuclease VII large subunit